MKRRQLIGLFVCNLVPWTVGNAMVALLPIYAVQLGASPAVTGYFMAFAFFCLAVATPLAGWLADRIQRRKAPLFVAALFVVPIVYLLGSVSELWQLIVFTGVSWFFAGINIALVNIMAGLFAEKNERGRVFGVIGASIGASALLGGLSAGPLVDYGGFGFMFLILTAVALVTPIVVPFLADKKPQETRTTSDVPPEKAGNAFRPAFWMLVCAHLMAFFGNAAFNMGRSLSMDEMGFSSTAISSTTAVSGVVMIAVPLLLGWLSDRLGRKPLQLLCYVSFVLCTVVLCLSKSLWLFWLSSVLLAVAMTSNSVGAALVTDLVPAGRLGVGLSLFQNASWLGNVVGLVIIGNLISLLGMSKALLLAVMPPCAAVVVLACTRFGQRRT